MVPVVIHTERTEMNVCRYLEAKRVPWVPSYDPAAGGDVVAGGEIEVEGFWLFLMMKVEFGGGGLSGGENSVANGTFVILRFPSGRFELVQVRGCFGRREEIVVGCDVIVAAAYDVIYLVLFGGVASFDFLVAGSMATQGLMRSEDFLACLTFKQPFRRRRSGPFRLVVHARPCGGGEWSQKHRGRGGA
nr:hypothetical protein Iba_chr09dCG1080 [Ipomoea batatas]